MNKLKSDDAATVHDKEGSINYVKHVTVVITRVKLGIFGQTAEIGQQPCLFHILNIGIRNKFTKQTVKIMMRRLIRNRLIWIYTVCKIVCEFT